MENTNSEPKVIYRHIRIPGYEKTIAAKLIDGVYKYGIAHCSPKDQYCKKSGRKLAESRLDNGTLTLEEIWDKFDGTLMNKQAFDKIKEESHMSDFKTEVILDLIMNKELI